VGADGGGLKLRVWTDPVVTGTASPLDGGGEDGDLVGTTLVGLTGPDDYGDWIASGWIVDDRFLDLTDLASTPVVRGVVRDQGARANPVLAVIEMGDP
jgi:hypothetical protein